MPGQVPNIHLTVKAGIICVRIDGMAEVTLELMFEVLKRF